MHILVSSILAYVLLCVFVSDAAHIPHTPTTTNSQLGFCQPYSTTFNEQSEILHHNELSNGSNSFVVTSGEGSYMIGKDGLEMYLEEPSCGVTTDGKVNDIAGDGATVNSTFTLLYGKVTFEMSAPSVAGVVSAAILIGTASLFYNNEAVSAAADVD